jgi:hypothetical protein
MQKTIQVQSQMGEFTPHTALAREIGWGWIGGLAATGVMDLVLMGALSALGLPAFTCFSIVGDTAARFFSTLGIEIAGGISLGVATHYLIGPLVGVTFAIVLVNIEVLRGITLRKAIFCAVLYVEIIAQPILAATPILLKMTADETLVWFGGSFVMHLIYGVLLGAIVQFGLSLAKVPHSK